MGSKKAAKKKAARAGKPAAPAEPPAAPAEPPAAPAEPHAAPAEPPAVPAGPIVLVGVFDVDEADPKYFHLLPVPGSKSYYRIPLAKAEFTLNSSVDFKPAPPPNGQAVIVRIIKDGLTRIECVQNVAANYLKGPIAGAHLALAMTVGKLAAEIGMVDTMNDTCDP